MEKVTVYYEIDDNGRAVRKEHHCVALKNNCPLGF